MLVPVVELYLADLTIWLKWIRLLKDFVSGHGNCSRMSISCWQAFRVPDLWDSVVQIRPQGGWMALMTWGGDMCSCVAEIPNWLPRWTVWGCVWPLRDPGRVLGCSTKEKIRGSEMEQGMGIKSALILNYSRDKNSCPKRSVDVYGSPSSLGQTF